MWDVTLQATGYFLVPVMTAVTKKLCMPTGRFHHLLADLCMAGQAFFPGRLERVAQGFQWPVRIDMTVQAIADLEMWFTFMAKGAGDERFGPLRRMLRMAVEAAHLGGVSATTPGDHSSLERMTLRAIFYLQLRNLGCKDKRIAADQQQ